MNVRSHARTLTPLEEWATLAKRWEWSEYRFSYCWRKLLFLLSAAVGTDAEDVPKTFFGQLSANQSKICKRGGREDVKVVSLVEIQTVSSSTIAKRLNMSDDCERLSLKFASLSFICVWERGGKWCVVRERKYRLKQTSQTTDVLSSLKSSVRWEVPGW